MNLLCDVTNLGLSFGSDLTRTGIFRASLGFVREILNRPEIEPRFAAMQSYAGEVQLARFERDSALLGQRWLRVWEPSPATLEESMELVEQLRAAGEATPAGRRLAASIRLVNATARHRPPRGGFDILHSLREPLVPRDRVNARARVLTVYDMVPFLFPELVEERFVERQRAIVDSVDRERDWIICSSACTKTDFCEITSMALDRVFVIPLAAARDVFRPETDAARIAAVRERHRIRSRDYVLSVCTLEPRKNLGRLVRSFFALTEEQRLPDLSLVLVGPTGWKSDALFASLEERAGLRDRVVLTGFVPDDDLASLYSGARMFVYPSLYEGFGLPALEAMQCGAPVITSRTGSLPEIVAGDAITVDPTDENALSQAMLGVLRDGRLAADLGRRGLERSKQFSWSRTVEETVRVYRAMLADS